MSSAAFLLSPAEISTPSSVLTRGQAFMTSPRWARRRTYQTSGRDCRKAASSSVQGGLAANAVSVGEVWGDPVEDGSSAEAMLLMMRGRYMASVQGFILEVAEKGDVVSG